MGQSHLFFPLEPQIRSGLFREIPGRVHLARYLAQMQLHFTVSQTEKQMKNAFGYDPGGGLLIGVFCLLTSFNPVQPSGSELTTA